jgi:hypothetical protein
MRLGCLNHALLTVDALQPRGSGLAGWIANHIDPDMSRAQRSSRPAPRIAAPLSRHPAIMPAVRAPDRACRRALRHKAPDRMHLSGENRLFSGNFVATVPRYATVRAFKQSAGAVHIPGFESNSGMSAGAPASPISDARQFA